MNGISIIRFLLSPEDTSNGFSAGPPTPTSASWQLVKAAFWLVLSVTAAIVVGQL